MYEAKAKNITTFLHAIENLKNECRHSWTSKGRQESVAEHSWRLSLMLIVCAPYLEKKIDLLKALKLALVHDIGEAKIGDKHHLEIIESAHTKMERSQSEYQAVQELTCLLGKDKSTIFKLWAEFENRSSEESKVVYFLDKLEACIQHNEAGISTWTAKEIASIVNYFNDLTIDAAFLSKLKDVIKSDSLNLINT